MIKKMFICLFILFIVIGCKENVVTDNPVGNESTDDKNSVKTEPELVIIKSDESDILTKLTLAEIWKVSKDIGIALKDYPFPFINDSVIIFNTKSGLNYFDLNAKKSVSFYEGDRYYDYDEDRSVMVLTNGDLLKLVNIRTNKTIWSISNPLKGFERIHIYNNYILIRDSKLNFICLNFEDGKQLWNKNLSELLEVDYTYTKKRRWRIPDDPFYSLGSFSEFVFSDDSLTFGVVSGFVYNYSLKNGDENWRLNLGYPANGPIVATGKHIFVGTTKGRVFVISGITGIVDKILVAEGETNVKSIGRTGNLLYFFTSPVFILKINDFSVHSAASIRTGYAYPHSVSIAGDYIWSYPVNPYDSGYYIQGFNINDITASKVYYDPEGRGYGPMEVAEGAMEQDENIERFKKNHLLEWNGQFILVEPDEIVAYKIVPEED